ncbi:MAG: histidine kinase [Actinobacteria bacterium]|uniref:histidine kinase n=2 Tax=freshwater metagenome TaxID=449393 RepID=A0A6J6Y1D4_9ZZZZ|nr:histidine kinase [Actinomycetota bacterium]MSX99805.1 histidine kinase [Actinomycetota bacterium]
MAKLKELLRDRSSLSDEQIRRIRELTADWQLLADLSFADLILWVPLRKDFKSWPSGYVAVAHIRPTTAATVFMQDLIGEEITWGARPRIDQALSGAEIIRDAEPEKFGDIYIKEETIPVILDEQVIAVISRHRNAELMRQPSRLELNYREVAHNVYRMVAEGTFPYTEHSENFDPAVRVGDGLIRLDINGAIIYASPNAKSAFSRMGWSGELEGNNLGEVARSVSLVKLDAHEEALEVGLSGKALRRVEIENSGGTVDLLALPLLAGGDRIGAIVLLQNVTELRRRERELVTKDATIREIHHRVKNNLQTVSALLRLQSRRIEDPAASAALNEAVRRIASIALVHETLSSSAEASVAFDDVLSRLVSHALDLSPRMGELQISRNGELGALDPRIATPLSLVVTELIHNALEHGLAESGNHLTISVSRNEGDAQITIFDDGIGLPEGFSLAQSSNLGLQIVRTLTENELRGNIDLVRTPSGTEARLTFPV